MIRCYTCKFQLQSISLCWRASRRRQYKRGKLIVKATLLSVVSKEDGRSVVVREFATALHPCWTVARIMRLDLDLCCCSLCRIQHLIGTTDAGTPVLAFLVENVYVLVVRIQQFRVSSHYRWSSVWCILLVRASGLRQCHVGSFQSPVVSTWWELC